MDKLHAQQANALIAMTITFMTGLGSQDSSSSLCFVDEPGSLGSVRPAEDYLTTLV